MPVPKRKRSKARRDKRFANKGIKARAFATCQNCDDFTVPHAVCQNCGHYRGRKVLAQTKDERSELRTESRKSTLAMKQAKMQQAMNAAPVEEDANQSK